MPLGRTDKSFRGLLARHAAILDRFEDAWLAGAPLEIEELLASVEASDRLPLLVELVQIDLERRLTSGQDTSAESYLARFPELAAIEEAAAELIAANLAIRSAKERPVGNAIRGVPDPADGSTQPASDTWRAAQTATSPSRFPRPFGDYELLSEIARGGMGVVYKARQIKLNRLVALKMIRSAELADDEQVRRFYSEAEAAAKLDHPGIVPVYEVGEANGQHFFSMALVSGASLSDRVKADGPLPPQEAAQLLKTVAQAVEYAHGKQIIHRDIKPQNILLDESGQPRLTDFGLAKQIKGPSDLTASGQVMGTPSYMPPEQARGQLDAIGPASDVYSLGATLYFLLTGRPPFQTASPIETLQQVLDTEPVSPRRLNPAVPRDLETICLKCLEKNSAPRYGSAQALTDELGRFLRGEPISARPIGRISRAARWCRRKPALAAAACLGGLLVATMAIGGPVIAVRESRQNAALVQETNEANTARQAATVAERTAETERAKAEARAAIAQEQSQLALNTLTGVISNLQRSFANVPGGTEVRERLLATALEQLDQVSKEYAAKATVDRVTMVALGDLADSILELGHASPLAVPHVNGATNDARPDNNTSTSRSAVLTAERLHRRAYEIAKHLAEADPEALNKQHDLVVALHALGRVSAKRGNIPEALARFEEGLGICRTQTNANAGDARWQVDLAKFLYQVGNALHDMGRTDESLRRFEEALACSQTLADQDLSNADRQREFAIVNERVGAVILKLGRTEDAVARFEEGLRIKRALANAEPGNSQKQGDLCESLDQLGEAFLKVGRTKDAAAHFEESLKISRASANADPHNLRWQENLWISLRNLGKTYKKLGRIQDALSHLEECERICRTLNKADPDNIQWQGELFDVLTELGDVYLTVGRVEDALAWYEASLKFRRTLSDADPGDSKKQRCLSPLLTRLGNVLFILGRTDEALARLEDSLNLSRALAEADPLNAEMQNELAVAFGNLGNMLLMVGRTKDAHSMIENGLRIARKVAEADPDSFDKQCLLCNAFDNFGKVLLTLGRAEDALAPFQESLTIRKAFTEHDPSDHQKQADLSASFGNLGNAFLTLGRAEDALAQFKYNLRIRRVLAETDFLASQRRRDLYLSLERVGYALFMLGRTHDALVHYNESLMICRELAEADPRNIELQRDLSVSFDRLGSAYLKLRRTDDALEQFEELLKRSRSLADADPRNAQKQRDLAVSHSQMGEVADQAQKYGEAIAQFEMAIGVLHRMIERGQLEEYAKKHVAHLKQRIVRCTFAKKALQDWDSLLKVEAKDLPLLLRFRAEQMFMRGDIAVAVQAADKLRELDRKDKNILHDAACIYARCAEVVASERDPPNEAQRTKHQELLRLAVDCLKESVASGFDDFDHLRMSNDFKILHGRPEFEALFPKRP